MDVRETFRLRLMEARSKAGLSQTEAAEAVGEVSEKTGKPRGQTVYEWEKGIRTPNADQLAQLVRAYDVSGHWLVTGEGPMRPGSDGDAYRLHVIGEIAEGQVSPTTLRMIEELRRLESLGATAEEIGESIGRLRSDANARAES